VAIVLASDGLWDVLDEDDVAKIVLASAKSVSKSGEEVTAKRVLKSGEGDCHRVGSAKSGSKSGEEVLWSWELIK
jgi:serine/threonine protein phosphatase PrpC